MKESVNEFVLRMREKYKNELEKLETQGPKESQKKFEEMLDFSIDLMDTIEVPLTTDNLVKTLTVLKILKESQEKS